ncbi:MAG: Poxvirus G6 [Proteobacteria bacterium]|nr:Poxvirus G6 [Pseudomonadota bacterium]
MSRLQTHILLLGLILLQVACSASQAYAPDSISSRQASNSDTKSYCQTHTLEHRSAVDNEFTTQELRNALSVFEAALSLRAISIDVARDLKRKIDKGLPLVGKDLDLLRQGMVEHLQVRENLMAIAKAHACWPGMQSDELVKHGVNHDSHALGVHLSLAAALVLYDNYLLSISIYEQNRKLRDIINRKDRGYNLDSNVLTKIHASYIEPENRNYLRKAIAFYEANREKQISSYGDDMEYLELLIEQSPSYSNIKNKLGLAGLVRDFSLLRRLGLDRLGLLSKEGMNLFSSLFGNTVGLVETRRGRLNKKKSVHRHLSGLLQPGDILLEKTPFRLTDKLIPGHWGHAAVWIGTRDELVKLGIGEHDLVRRYWKEIGNNRSIVEALRSGVKLSSLKHFMNVDDLAVLRPVGLTDKKRRRIVIQALRQMGKAYDFNFDVETTDRIVCSELVYLSHEHIDWPTSNTLGRATISPDQISKQSGPGKPLKAAALYLGGRRVQSNIAAKLSRLR